MTDDLPSPHRPVRLLVRGMNTNISSHLMQSISSVPYSVNSLLANI